MAGDFIKVEKSTARKPEVLRIAMLLSIHPDHAFGLCIRFWSWCDDNMTDGTAKLSCQILDAVLGTSGFAAALIEVGWLKDRKNALEIPNFDRHLSQSAKVRCAATERKRKSRESKAAAAPSQESVTAVTKKRDQRREEKSKENKPPYPPSAKPPPDPDGWDLKLEDLRNPDRLLRWLTHTRLLPGSHQDQELTLAAAERALSVAQLGGEPVADRVAYFVSIVRDRTWQVITDQDRDRGKLRHLEWCRRGQDQSAAAMLVLSSPD